MFVSSRDLAVAAMVLAACGPAPTEEARVDFPDHWIDGTSEAEPRYQVHALFPGTWAIRQSLTTHFEAPFLYLLMGDDRAVLLDTGAPADPWVRAVVDDLIGSTFPLVVAHSHAHGDHVAGDEEFRSRPNTEIVGHGPEDVAGYFAMAGWPDEPATLELGGRSLRVIPIPGHEPSSVAVYDPRTRILFTGDSLYPGRLYVRDFDAYRRSMNRLVDTFYEVSVSWVLGTHIEMTDRPGVDYERGQESHPDERRLELEWDHVLQLQQLLSGMGAGAEHTILDDYIVYPLR